MRARTENTASKSKDQDQKRYPGLFAATLGVIKAALTSNVDQSYEYQFPQRKILHEKAPPRVQAVNQHLDKEGVDLHPNHVPHFERGTQIEDHPGEGYQHNLEKQAKTIKNEKKIANSFREELQEEAKKGNQADPRKMTYAKAGYLAHTLLGTTKAAMNPYVIHEDGLGIGTVHDYLDFHQEMKNGLKF